MRRLDGSAEAGPFTRPSQLKPSSVLHDLRRGYKPCPFKAT